MSHWSLRSRPTVGVALPRKSGSVFDFRVVTAASTAHTKGAWAEIIASSSADAHIVQLTIGTTSTSTANTSILLDLGFGAAGSERVVVANLGAGFLDFVTTGGRTWQIPLFVPAGTRIAARIQGVIASDTAEVAVDLYGGQGFEGFSTFAAVETYGADTTASRGVILTASATANAVGAWTQVVASTVAPIRAMFLSVQGASSATMNTAANLIDIGMGASGSEVAVVSGIYARTSSVEFIQLVIPPGPMLPQEFDIPAGVRLAARNTSSTASNAVDITLHGMR